MVNPHGDYQQQGLWPEGIYWSVRLCKDEELCREAFRGSRPASGAGKRAWDPTSHPAEPCHLRETCTSKLTPPLPKSAKVPTASSLQPGKIGN